MINRNPQQQNETDETATKIILKREPYKRDKNGNIWKGDYPEEYFDRVPSLFNKDATLANKNKTDLRIDFRHVLIQNRLIRENIPDEDYTIDHLIKEYDLEYSAVNLNTMNKEGSGNNRRLINTNITEATLTRLGEKDSEDKELKKIMGMFKRK